MAKKKSGKKKVSHCQRSFGKRRRGKCLGTPQYFCDKEKKYLCYDCSHMNDTLKYCCHYKFLSSSGMSFSEEEELGEGKAISDCDRKKCKSKEANYWCDRRQKWFCTDHFHASRNCCNYFGSSGEKWRSGEDLDYRDIGRENAKLKEVKFVNS